MNMILHCRYIVKNNFYSKLTVSLGIGLLALVLGYMTDIRLLQKKLYATKEQKIKISQLLQHKNQATRKAPTEQQKIESPQIQYATKLKQFAGDFDTTDILNAIEKAASHSQIELQMLEPQANKEDEFFIIYPIKLEIGGSYKNLLGFVNNVFKQPYFIVFEEFALQKKASNDGGDELNMQALVAVYRNKIPVKTSETPLQNNSAINSPENDIFTKTIAKTNLFLWAIKELTFLGMIKQNQSVYGFVSDPMGGIHRVAVGDKIGLKQSKITAIDEHGITTENK
jgi:type IV pilus assembly protein PilO